MIFIQLLGDYSLLYGVNSFRLHLVCYAIVPFYIFSSVFFMILFLFRQIGGKFQVQLCDNTELKWRKHNNHIEEWVHCMTVVMAWMVINNAYGNNITLVIS